MKKTFVAVFFCMALLSSFTVSASAYDVNDIYIQVTAIRDELGYPKGDWSSLRRAINYIADNLPSSPKDYSTTLSNIYNNTSSLASTVNAIKGDTNNISNRSTDILNKLADISTNIGTAQIAITNHLDSFATQNHSDWDFLFNSVLNPWTGSATSSPTDFNRYPYITSGSTSLEYGTFGRLVLFYGNNLVNDTPTYGSGPTLYKIIHQLQQVLASDDDLQLKQDNKANEDAATDAFVNGSSSNTSLGPGDIGNLKFVGGTFNDLTSLNGQSSVTSFLSGLTSADGTGQGWFSEATRASLDAVSSPVTTTRLVRKTWRGEKSLTYSISEDTSVNLVNSPAPVADSDPYNMSCSPAPAIPALAAPMRPTTLMPLTIMCSTPTPR